MLLSDVLITLFTDIYLFAASRSDFIVSCYMLQNGIFICRGNGVTDVLCFKHSARHREKL